MQLTLLKIDIDDYTIEERTAILEFDANLPKNIALQKAIQMSIKSRLDKLEKHFKTLKQCPVICVQVVNTSHRVDHQFFVHPKFPKILSQVEYDAWKVSHTELA